MKAGHQALVTQAALRQAITDLERLANGEDGSNMAAVPVLARLYTTYAQITLEAYGISVDLPSVCGDHLTYGFTAAQPRSVTQH